MRSFPYPIPEEKKVRVILDTDCACEADDPYAIVHALLSPKISVTGICAEHFADRFGPDSMEESYREILHVLDLAGLNGQVPVSAEVPAHCPTKPLPLLPLHRSSLFRRLCGMIPARCLSPDRVL